MLGLRLLLTSGTDAVLNNITEVCQLFSTQMNRAKCNKTSCLNNAFNTTFYYVYFILQDDWYSIYIEQQWNKAIALVIHITCNAAGMAKNFARVILYNSP